MFIKAGLFPLISIMSKYMKQKNTHTKNYRSTSKNKLKQGITLARNIIDPTVFHDLRKVRTYIRKTTKS